MGKKKVYKCKNCEAVVSDTQKFCQECGGEFIQDQETPMYEFLFKLSDEPVYVAIADTQKRAIELFKNFAKGEDVTKYEIEKGAPALAEGSDTEYKSEEFREWDEA